jgi:TolB protein
MPALSRDGKKLAFVADPNNGNREIFIMPIGGRPRQLTDNPGMDLQPTFSPDGKQVAFQSEREGHMLLMAVNADGTEETQLVDGDGWNPVYSPDGKKLLFLSTRDGQTDIYLATLETKAVTRVTNTEDAEGCPVFSPDGSEVAFIATSDKGKKDIFVMALNGNGLRRVTTTGNVVSFSWGW